MKLILVGYMCSGKTSIGTLIAKKMNVPFFDLDQLIEDKEGKSVATIFETKGEFYFRKLERTILEYFLVTHSNFVLALGGGTPCYYENYKLYQSDEVTSVFLKTSIDTLVNRIESNKIHRPLLKHINKELLSDFVAKHLFDRNYYYNQVTKVLSTNDLSEEKIVEILCNTLT